MTIHTSISYHDSVNVHVQQGNGKVKWLVLCTYLLVCCINSSTMRQKQFDHVHVTVPGSMMQRSPFPPAQGFSLGRHAGKDSRPLRDVQPLWHRQGTSMCLRACNQRAFNCV